MIVGIIERKLNRSEVELTDFCMEGREEGGGEEVGEQGRETEGERDSSDTHDIVRHLSSTSTSRLQTFLTP